MGAEHSEEEFWGSDPVEGTSAHPLLALVHKRDQVLYYWQKILPQFEPSGVVLEVGSGSGWLSAINNIRFPLNTQVATDVSKNALQKGLQVSSLIEAKLDYLVAAPTEILPFTDSSFDFVIGCAVLHHTHLSKATREIYRVLKPGGTYLGFREPFIPKALAVVWGSRFGLAGGRQHELGVREGLYTLKEWESAFRSAGFASVDLNLEKDPRYQNHNWFVNVYYRVVQHLPDGFIRKCLACSFVVKARK